MKVQLKLVLMTVAAAALVLSACQEKPSVVENNTMPQSSEQSSHQSSTPSSFANDSNSTFDVDFDPDAQIKLPDSKYNDFEYVIKNNGTNRFEFGKFYGFSDTYCVTRNLAYNNSKTIYGEYSLSSGLHPLESTLEDFCNLYNVNSDNAITSYTRYNDLTVVYPFDKDLLDTYETPDANSYVIVETCWAYQGGKWERMSAATVAALGLRKNTFTSDAILSIAIELDNATKRKVRYIYVSYGTPSDFNSFHGFV